jgi:hypothetical protein
MNKLTIIARLLKDNHITVDEAAVLLEVYYKSSNQQITTIPCSPVADWTYRPSITTCGTSIATNEPKPAYGGC